MQTFSMLALATLLAGSSLVNGHMVMKTPKPFGNPNNSPLDPSGSDFPCKGGPYDRSSVQNVMAVGSSQTLSFTGSAVHGGGSCQVALTTDLEPTASSKWMVIKSIEGGCPASVAGNLPEDPNGSGASTFQYSIPDGIAPGEYVIAWSWINKIGNREFYMNCGPATITGAQKKRYVPSGVSLARRQSTFPDLFVANIAGVSNGCTTPEGSDYRYPNPGADVEEAGSGPYTDLSCGSGGNNPAPKPTGGAGADAGPSGTPSGSPASPTAGSGAGFGAGNGNGVGAPQPSGSVGAGGPPPASPTTGSSGFGAGNGNGAGASQPSGSVGAGGPPSQQGPQSQTGDSPVVEPGNFAGEAAPLPSDSSSAAPAASSAPSSPPAPASPVSGEACTEGDWRCSASGNSFARCASGAWSVDIQMAAGMRCTPGTTTNLEQAPAR